MNRLTALLIAVALWAGIFLPGLGSTELKGEEGRRIMPAVTMAEGGDWVVPYVGGEPFLRKPPLVQWCIALSLKTFGHNPWAARLPSALSVLALAATMILATRGWLKVEQALVAAVVMMTQVAIVDKCRLAELEAVYSSLSGIALVLWMSWWAQGRSAWLVWTVPFIFNALALLAKAPLHLLFFYAVVLGATIASGEWKRVWGRGRVVSLRIAFGWLLVLLGVWLWFFKRQQFGLVPFAVGAVLLPPPSRPHFVGVAVMLGLFALWEEPYYHRVDPAELAKTLQHQAVDRFNGADATLGKWLLNLPMGIGDHLPWLLLAPLLWRNRAAEGLPERGAGLLRGGRWAVAGCFVGLLLIPGVLPRYVLPLTAPFSVLLAQALWRCPRWVRRAWRGTLWVLGSLLALGAVATPFLVARAVAKGGVALSPVLALAAVLPVVAGVLLLRSCRRDLREVVRLSLGTGLVAAMGLTLYAVCAVPWIRLHEELRPFAQRIDASVPSGGPLLAYSVGDYPPLLAVLFHVRTPYAYAVTDKDAPAGTAYYLMRGRDREKFARKFETLALVASMEGRDGEKPAVVLQARRIP